MRFIFLILFANLLILDGLIVYNYLGKKEPQTNKAAATSIYNTATPSLSTETSVPREDCNADCRAEIALNVVKTLKLTPTPKPVTERIVIQNPKSTSPQTSQTQTASTAHEFFIPLGSGSILSTDWTDVPGVKAQIDSSKYSNVKQVLFEASARVPNANQIIEVRLYNESDSYVVGNSEFVYPSGTSEIFRIAAIQLGSGAKIYKVQMKTQLGYSAILDQARIHITTN